MLSNSNFRFNPISILLLVILCLFSNSIEASPLRIPDSNSQLVKRTSNNHHVIKKRDAAPRLTVSGASTANLNIAQTGQGAQFSVAGTKALDMTVVTRVGGTITYMNNAWKGFSTGIRVLNIFNNVINGNLDGTILAAQEFVKPELHSVLAASIVPDGIVAAIFSGEIGAAIAAAAIVAAPVAIDHWKAFQRTGRSIANYIWRNDDEILKAVLNYDATTGSQPLYTPYYLNHLMPQCNIIVFQKMMWRENNGYPMNFDDMSKIFWNYFNGPHFASNSVSAAQVSPKQAWLLINNDYFTVQAPVCGDAYISYRTYQIGLNYDCKDDTNGKYERTFGVSADGLKYGPEPHSYANDDE